MGRHVISNLAEYVATVDSITEKWNRGKEDIIYPWFRGHSNETFSLLPGLYRNEDDSYQKISLDEQNCRHDFEMKAYPFLLNASYGTPQSSVEWYFLMQHFGGVTRLLDWTESSLAALHFAVFYKNSNMENACVWMLHPFEFNKILHRLNQIWIFPKDINGYVPPLWVGKAVTERDPMALQPVLKSTRITAQKGNFTIHGYRRMPLDRIKRVASCFEKVVIEHQSIKKIKQELYINGITESVLFPDLSGLCREINDYYHY